MKKYFFCISILIAYCFSFAQTKDIDSLLTILRTDKEDTAKAIHLNNLSNKYILINKDSALHYANEALMLANNLPTFRPGKDGIGWLKGIADAYNNIGSVYYNGGNYSKALEHYFKALKIDEELQSKIGIAKCFADIATIYTALGNYNKAIDYSFKALKINEELGIKRSIAASYNTLGNIFFEQQDHAKAEDYYFKALKINEEIGNKSGIAACLSNIGGIYSAQLNYTKAANYHFKALKMDEEIGNKIGIACDMVHIGCFYITTKNYTEAEQYLLQSLSISDSLKNMSGQKDAAENLSIVYSKTGKHQKALEYYQRAMIAKDSLFSEEKNKELTSHEMNFEFEKKEAVAKAEQEKKDLLADKKKIITSSVIIILIILVIAIILLLRQQRLKRKKDQIIFEKENELLISEKQRLESELIHSKKLLDNYMESMLEKSELLENFKTEVEALKILKSKEIHEEKIERLDQLNKVTILTEDDWYKFQELFEQVYKGFFVRLKEKLPNLTPAETRLVCLTKLKLTTKQMADVLGVSQDTIKKTRYRLRKKLVISEEEDIDELANAI